MLINLFESAEPLSILGSFYSFKLCLDNELATVKEIGTVAIRLALRKGREAGVEDNSLSVAVRPHSTNHLVTSINLSDDAGATADTKSNDKEVMMTNGTTKTNLIRLLELVSRLAQP